MKRITTFVYKGEAFEICKTEKGDLINHSMHTAQLVGLIVAIPQTNIKSDGTMKRLLTLGEMHNDLNPEHNTISHIIHEIKYNIDVRDFMKENNIDINTPDGCKILFNYLSSRIKSV